MGKHIQTDFAEYLTEAKAGTDKGNGEFILIDHSAWEAFCKILDDNKIKHDASNIGMDEDVWYVSIENPEDYEKAGELLGQVTMY